MPFIITYITWFTSPKNKITDKLTAQICSYGEKLSSLLIFYALSEKGVKCCTVDSGQIIKTNDSYLDASVNFDITNSLVNDKIKNLFANKKRFWQPSKKLLYSKTKRKLAQ